MVKQIENNVKCYRNPVKSVYFLDDTDMEIKKHILS